MQKGEKPRSISVIFEVELKLVQVYLSKKCTTPADLSNLEKPNSIRHFHRPSHGFHGWSDGSEAVIGRNMNMSSGNEAKQLPLTRLERELGRTAVQTKGGI
ncbi:hypothetical protein LZ32DRAFT_72613 [Colletotrichum eremochloae]|nr:hypothetical protein LZ32DRAFT_72613 [Colletotrichum eremochloae]